jgi:hypothetical protein
MLTPDILDLLRHKNPKGNPYTVAIVDDPNDGKTKLVVLFDTPGDIAVIPLDTLIDAESIEERGNSNADELETYLRGALEN